MRNYNMPTDKRYKEIDGKLVKIELSPQEIQERLDRLGITEEDLHESRLAERENYLTSIFQ